MIEELQHYIDDFVETYKYKNKIIDGIEYDVSSYGIGDDGVFITISLHDSDEVLGSVLFFEDKVVVSEYFESGVMH